MGEVINLGQFGKPRDSILSGVSDALAQGMDAGQKLNETKLRSQQLENAYKTELAKIEMDKKKQNLEYGYKLVKDVSTYMDSLPNDSTKELFKQSDHYKEIANVVKDILPEYYDKDKKELLTVNEPQPWAPKTAEEKLSFEKSLLEAKQAIENNAPMTPQGASSTINALNVAVMNGWITEGDAKPAIGYATKYLANKFNPSQSLGEASPKSSGYAPLNLNEYQGNTNPNTSFLMPQQSTPAPTKPSRFKVTPIK